MWFRKKKTAPAVVNKSPFAGFFSTHNNLEDNGEPMAERIQKAISHSIQRTHKDLKIYSAESDVAIAMDSAEAIAMDAGEFADVKMFNAQSGFLPPAQILWFANQAFIGYQTCAIFAQNWLVDKVCTMPARDAVRHGYEITVNDGSTVDKAVLDFMKRRDKAFNIKGNCVEFIRMGRIFGIRIALFQVESTDPKYYEKPFNIDGVTPGSYKGISQIDPYWITPELDKESAANPASRHFYEPTWWRIDGKRVHRTHLCIMRNGDELPDILKPTYFYGGIPVPQKVAERVFAAERTANEAPQLAMTKRLTVLKTDITQAAADPAAFTKKMGFWSELMSNFGIKVVGEGEEVEQYDTALGDVDTVIMTQYQLVAASGDTPATKLLGTSPKGFGASGDYETESYHEFLESLAEHDLVPLVNRHHALLIKSEVMPKFKCDFFHTEAVWNPIDTPTEKEQAEINKLKADTHAVYSQAGAVDGTDIRQVIIADKNSGYNGLPDVVPDGPGDREAQQEAEKALEQPVNAKPLRSESSGDEK